MQPLPVVLIAGQGLGVLSRHQVNHVRGQVVLAAGRQRVLAVLLVAGQAARLQAVQEKWVVQDAFDTNVFSFVQQVVVFVFVLWRDTGYSYSSVLYINLFYKLIMKKPILIYFIN